MWVVDAELVAEWIVSLDDDSVAQIYAAISILQDVGPNLGRPLVDTVEASRHSNMKELRLGSSGRKELRILFAFDPLRRGILLVGGDKSGQWDKWYKQNIPHADTIFDDHLLHLENEK